MDWLAPLEHRPKLSKHEYQEQSRTLRKRLQNAQRSQRESRTPAIVLIAGVDGAGKGDSVNLLNTWLDAHWVTTRAFDRPSDEEEERPALWRYWRALPAGGQTALFLSAWYSDPLLQRVYDGAAASLTAPLERIRSFEAMLAAGGYAIVKIWLHLSLAAQKQRFRELESDPLQSWRVTERDWQHYSLYSRFTAAAEELLTATHTAECPWTVIDGEDPRRRNLEVANTVLDAVIREPEQVLEAAPTQRTPPTERLAQVAATPPVALDRDAYKDELAQLQGRLNHLHREARARGISLIGVFEGRDAAGKGGAIRRIVPAFDARCIDVVRTGPPSEDERAHHYLWRFWRRIPRAGHVTLFDRSWYGRILVERVEDLVDEQALERAYGEINEFERQLVEHGIVLVKFWLEISRKEQKRRFDERQRVAHKRWKYTEDDVRNRGLWNEYDSAIADMLSRTDTQRAAWTIVSAEDKRDARLTTLRVLCEGLEKRLASAAPVN